MEKRIKLQANTKFSKEESIRFLTSEYEQCFSQMRHYDSIGISFVKFALTGYVALFSGLFALFKYLEEVNQRDINIGGILLSTFIISLIVLALMVRNRVYYVVVARQVNSLRNYFLNNAEIDFIKYNMCYIDPHLPRAFNFFSTYTFLFIVVALLNGLLGGIGSYLIIAYFKAVGGGIWIISLIIAVFLVITQLTLVAYYLSKKDSLYSDSVKPPQEAVSESGNG